MTHGVRDIVGQSIMLSFEGTEATPEVLEALTRTRANGVILFAQNISTPQQVYGLIHTLQTHAAAEGLPPLLIGIDQEGGIVSRLPAPFVTVPSQMAQAATGEPQAAYESARITGQQLRAVGINTNFAPSLDVNNNPANPVIGTRAFADNAERVTQFVLAALRGYHESGVIAVGKHFPGHGDTNIDSHLGLPTVRHAIERLRAIEFAPFAAAINAGVPGLMTAHLVFEALDNLPATLARAILTDFVRHSLGFEGVIFTDALNMQAIADTYGPTEASMMAKAAGADVVLPLGSLESQIAVADALCESVEAGRVPRAAFEATARRLNTLRAAYGMTHELPSFAEPDSTLYHAALDIARRSITVVRGADALPLPRETRIALIDCVVPRFSLVEEAYARAESLRSLVTAAFPNAISVTLGPDSSDVDESQAVALAQECEVVLLVTRNASLIEQQTRLAQALIATHTPVIQAAVRLPYDADVVDAQTTILTYGDPAVSLHALVEVLVGQVAPQGKAPVALKSLT